MGRKCFAPRCTTGYKSCKEKLSLFSVPKNEERLKLWRSAIPRKDRLLQPSDFLCEKHFEPHFVSKTWEAVYNDHVLVSAPRRAFLAPDAVPTRFPGCPSHLSKVVKQRKRPAERQALPTPKKLRMPRESPNLPADTAANQNEEESQNSNPHVSNEQESCTDSRSATFCSLFDEVPPNVLPSRSWGCHRLEADGVKSVLFLQVERVKGHSTESSMPPAPVASTKIVDISEDMTVRVVIMGIPIKKFDLRHCMSIEDVATLLRQVDEAVVCRGGPHPKAHPGVQLLSASVDIGGHWRHKQCPLILTDHGSCAKCSSLSHSLRSREKRMLARKSRATRRTLNLSPNAEKLATLRRANYALKRSKNRLKLKLKTLTEELKESRRKLNSITTESLEHKLAKLDLPAQQLTAIRECVSAAKCTNRRNRRYTESWLMTCLLLHIRSPSGYSFLRTNDILPLPCITTVRKYLTMLRVECGFDKRFFAAFKKKLSLKDNFQRHGVLVFDEIQVRKEVRVNSKTMTYIGLEDFGDEVSATDEPANHGLVFTFRSFGDQHAQPVAVFASKGPTKGKVLAQLVLKAILLLEEAGAFVDAVVCDGAATNRAMWQYFSVSGSLEHTRNFFVHPMDEQRSVYVFSDAPHLIKCVRNRLHAQKILKISGKCVQWSHFEKLYTADSKHPGDLRACPKITLAHVNPSNTEKMRVKLATQLFSRSVANGLQYYSKRRVQGLENVKATVDFTLRMNDMFDALNRGHPSEGIKPGCKDLRVLASSLHWLNAWEKELKSGNITRDSFLTQSTAEGLRVTLLSALQLSRYLLTNCGFKYVLTAKYNQDILERFFGIIRQVGGQNDHPSMPTFLQLYNMLCIYSLVKPPKFGNCQVETSEDSPLLTLSDFTSVFQCNLPTGKGRKYDELKAKLDGLIASGVECETAFDHIYTTAEVADCIIYYVTGFLCRKLLTHTQCTVCKRGLTDTGKFSDKPEAELVNCKTRGGLVHPTRLIFSLLQATETEFLKNADKRDAYAKTIDGIVQSYSFSFPCHEHKESIMAQLLHYYVSMRMRQFCKDKKRNMDNQTQKLRKLSKLV